VQAIDVAPSGALAEMEPGGLTSLMPAQQRAWSMGMQRTLGNQATARMLGEATSGGGTRSGSGESASEHVGPRPRIEVSTFSLGSASAAGVSRDKSTEESDGKQDQKAKLNSFGTSKKGVDIVVDAVDVAANKDYPDGFRFAQTVTTNDPGWTAVGAPLVDPPATYVDPNPADDDKPFYWTDAEEVTHKGQFEDHPGRPANASGTVVWDAILSLTGVNGMTVTRFDSLTYGFSVDSKGTVTARKPTAPASTAGHIAQLAKEFPKWTFK
jgi:hypothetical protein